MQFFVMDNNRKSGPLDDADLRTRYAQGQISPQASVWFEGQSDWIAIANFLQSVPAAAPHSPVPYHTQPVPSQPFPTAPTQAPIYIIREAPVIPGQFQGTIGGSRGSGLAMASFVCGLLGLLTFLPAPIAIVTGHLARGQTKRDPSLTGRGLATAGMLLGYAVTLCALGSAIFFILFLIFAGAVASSSH